MCWRGLDLERTVVHLQCWIKWLLVTLAPYQRKIFTLGFCLSVPQLAPFVAWGFIFAACVTRSLASCNIWDTSRKTQLSGRGKPVKLLLRKKTKLVLVLSLRKKQTMIHCDFDRNPRVLLISSCLRMNHARCLVPPPICRSELWRAGAGSITSRVPPGSNCITGEMIISDFWSCFFPWRWRMILLPPKTIGFHSTVHLNGLRFQMGTLADSSSTAWASLFRVSGSTLCQVSTVAQTGSSLAL